VAYNNGRINGFLRPGSNDAASATRKGLDFQLGNSVQGSRPPDGSLGLAEVFNVCARRVHANWWLGIHGRLVLTNQGCTECASQNAEPWFGRSYEVRLTINPVFVVDQPRVAVCRSKMVVLLYSEIKQGIADVPTQLAVGFRCKTFSSCWRSVGRSRRKLRRC